MVETIRKRAVSKAPAANYVLALTDSDSSVAVYKSEEESPAEAFALDQAQGKMRDARKEARDRPSKAPRQGAGAKAREIREQKQEVETIPANPKSKPAPQKREGAKTRSQQPQLVGQDINNPLP